MSPQRFVRLRDVITHAAVLLFLVASTIAQEAPPPKPDVDGQPVYLIAGKVVVYPKNVEKTPADYQGVLGRPFALIKLEEKVVGEIYARPLTGTPLEEANEMEKSPGNSKEVSVSKRGKLKLKDEEAEWVTLKMDIDSKLGQPWMMHSVYFPYRDGSTTFKLIASEERFKTALPYFEAMLFLNEDKPKKE